MESPLVVAQRAAIQEARARYERGDISAERMKSLLDVITEASDSHAVAEAMVETPPTPLRALAAFDLPRATSTGVASEQRGVARIVAFMGTARRTSRPWTLAARSRVTAFMGEVRLDLRQAHLERTSVMRVRSVMGDVRILVPEGVRVNVRARAFMGEVRAVGEYFGGIAGGVDGEHEPVDSTPLANLDIDVTSIMGTVKIVVARSAAAASSSVAGLARDVLRDAIVSVRARLKQSPAMGLAESNRALEPVRAADAGASSPAE